MLCGTSDWGLVRTFRENQLPWLKQFGYFSNGILSEDTLERVFSALNPKSFNENFMKWIEAIRKEIEGETIAFDGKTMRGAKLGKNSKNIPHIVSAFASKSGL